MLVTVRVGERIFPNIDSANLRPSDLVLDTNGNYFPARSYAEFAPMFPPETSVIEDIVKTVAVVGGALLVGVATVYVVRKTYQFVADHDFGTVEFPKWYRDQRINEHVDQHGWWCPECNRKVKVGSLSLDHIISLKNGGATSTTNAQVMCNGCNSSKGARNTIADHIWGRSL